jgi:hypothetical protein
VGSFTSARSCDCQLPNAGILFQDAESKKTFEYKWGKNGSDASTGSDRKQKIINIFKGF